MKKVYRFFILPNYEKKIISQAIGWLMFFRLLLWFVSYKRLKSIFSFEDTDSLNSTNVDWGKIKIVTRSVKKCSQYLPFMTCLVQALATRKILNSIGQSSSIKLGVGRDDDNNFVAHAWVEANGRIIIGKSNDFYRYSLMSNSVK